MTVLRANKSSSPARVLRWKRKSVTLVLFELPRFWSFHIVRRCFSPRITGKAHDELHVLLGDCLTVMSYARGIHPSACEMQTLKYADNTEKKGAEVKVQKP